MSIKPAPPAPDYTPTPQLLSAQNSSLAFLSSSFTILYKETIWYEYVRLTKQQALVLSTAFHKSFCLGTLGTLGTLGKLKNNSFQRLNQMVQNIQKLVYFILNPIQLIFGTSAYTYLTFYF
ncbi:MAG: hypothetical protein EZS28_008673 [Streblomastix strix]|uniref:Uncharacterized protein n=1 Tax=Streblomastix strix TaxID=222440 RepID=A0A5J4WLQ2_9EUKA|nr:MAG: hypothetical protein EZS28_008673 [Streblomastix strix]